MARAQDVGAARSTNPDLAPAAGIADVGIAYICLNQLRPDAAARFAEQGTRLLERTTFAEMVFRADFVWSEALSLSGRFADANSLATEGMPGCAVATWEAARSRHGRGSPNRAMQPANRNSTRPH